MPVRDLLGRWLRIARCARLRTIGVAITIVDFADDDAATGPLAETEHAEEITDG